MIENTPYLPLSLKIIYSLFMLIFLPVYLKNYGVTNFLYFCDVALLLTWIGIWREDSLLISMCAVGILLPQALWIVDFILAMLHLPNTGLTEYMFDSNRSLFLRGLSLFHMWLPILLMYLVWKLGYDPRAFLAWTILAWVLLIVCFVFIPGPREDAGIEPVNINYVWGVSSTQVQTWMPPYAWFVMLLAGLPAVFFFPTHWILKHFLEKT